MEIKIIEKQNQSLAVYKDGGLLFYSTIKFNWFNRVVKIYNPHDVLVLELKHDTYSYEILHQNKFMTKLISNINNETITFNTNKRLFVKSRYFISINQDFNYFLKKDKIAQVKQKTINYCTAFLLDINEEYLEFTDQIILHVLAIKTGFSYD